MSNPTPPTPEFTEFVQGYLVCALWSSNTCDEEGNNCTPLDEDHDIEDIAPEARATCEEDCRDFFDAQQATLKLATDTPGYTWGRAGHDFWLTRNGHGAGFWDRGLGGLGARLTEAAQVYDSVYLYVGDDGKVYL